MSELRHRGKSKDITKPLGILPLIVIVLSFAGLPVCAIGQTADIMKRLDQLEQRLNNLETQLKAFREEFDAKVYGKQPEPPAEAMKWEVEHRDVSDLKFSAGLKAVREDEGLLLSYGDGTMDGKRSMAGSGHATFFHVPPGNWLIDRVDLFGSRYGYPQPPREDFHIYICDANMKVIKDIPKPYAMFNRGEEVWVNMSFTPVKVSSPFYVCLSFNPERTKGIFVGFDNVEPISHSRNALPNSHVLDTQGKFDWMLRAHIIPEQKLSIPDLDDLVSNWTAQIATITQTGW